MPFNVKLIICLHVIVCLASCSSILPNYSTQPPSGYNNSDKELLEIKNNYVSALEKEESTAFRLEVNSLQYENDLLLLPGIYSNMTYINPQDTRTGIIVFEQFIFDDDYSMQYLFRVYRQGGASFEWSAAGDYSVKGRVLTIDNPRGDARILPFDLPAKRRIRCILNESHEDYIRVGCNDRDFNNGGLYFSYSDLP